MAFAGHPAGSLFQPLSLNRAGHLGLTTGSRHPWPASCSRKCYIRMQTFESAPEPGEPPIPADLERKIRDHVATLSNEDVPSPLSYLALRDAGRIDLVEPIMNAGGYISVSKRLSIQVDESFLEAKKSEKSTKTSPRFSDANTGPGPLALGQRREARLNGEIMSSSNRSILRIDTSNDRAYRGPEDVPDAAELASIGQDIVDIRDEIVPEGERLVLDTKMRLGTLALVASCAIGYGRTSGTVMDPHVVYMVQNISQSLLCAHAAAAAYAAAVLAPALGRKRFLWTLKVLLAGPVGLVTMRQLGGTNSSTASN